MEGFPNPYAEEREQSKGELTQEWAEFFKMAAFFFGVTFTDREKAAIPVVLGALLRERKKFQYEKALKWLERFLG